MYENISPNVDIQIIENVPEYEEKGYEQSLACQKLGEDFDGKSFKIDPRVLGLPTARARVYILAWKKAKFSWSPDFSLMEFLDVVTSQVTLDASEYWWMDIPRTKLTPSTESRLQSQFTECLSETCNDGARKSEQSGRRMLQKAKPDVHVKWQTPKWNALSSMWSYIKHPILNNSSISHPNVL